MTLVGPGICCSKLVDPQRGIPQGVYVLDDIGTRIWQLLVEHGDVATVVEGLLAEYDVGEAVLNRDLTDLWSM